MPADYAKHVAAVGSKVLDGRSREGRVARVMNLHIGRALEEIALLTDGEVL